MMLLHSTQNRSIRDKLLKNNTLFKKKLLILEKLLSIIYKKPGDREESNVAIKISKDSVSEQKNSSEFKGLYDNREEFDYIPSFNPPLERTNFFWGEIARKVLSPFRPGERVVGFNKQKVANSTLKSELVRRWSATDSEISDKDLSPLKGSNKKKLLIIPECNGDPPIHQMIKLFPKEADSKRCLSKFRVSLCELELNEIEKYLESTNTGKPLNELPLITQGSVIKSARKGTGDNTSINEQHSQQSQHSQQHSSNKGFRRKSCDCSKCGVLSSKQKDFQDLHVDTRMQRKLRKETKNKSGAKDSAGLENSLTADFRRRSFSKIARGPSFEKEKTLYNSLSKPSICKKESLIDEKELMKSKTTSDYTRNNSSAGDQKHLISPLKLPSLNNDILEVVSQRDMAPSLTKRKGVKEPKTNMNSDILYPILSERRALSDKKIVPILSARGKDGCNKEVFQDVNQEKGGSATFSLENFKGISNGFKRDIGEYILTEGKEEKSYSGDLSKKYGESDVNTITTRPPTIQNPYSKHSESLQFLEQKYFVNKETWPANQTPKKPLANSSSLKRFEAYVEKKKK